MKPDLKFNNKENEIIHTKDGRTLWNSRSVAVSTVLIIVVNGVEYILLIKRGSGVPDFVGYWANVTGYLDWNENATEAIYREMYEEAGLDVKSLIESGKILFGSFEHPAHVETNPNSKRQNVSLRYKLVLELDSLPEVFVDEPECSDGGFFNFDEIERKISSGEMQLAFNHAEVISMLHFEWNFRKIKMK